MVGAPRVGELVVVSAGADEIRSLGADDPLVGEAPWECRACLAAEGPLCGYHEVWASGWDACAAAMALLAAGGRAADVDRSALAVADVGDVAGIDRELPAGVCPVCLGAGFEVYGVDHELCPHCGGAGVVCADCSGAGFEYRTLEQDDCATCGGSGAPPTRSGRCRCEHCEACWTGEYDRLRGDGLSHGEAQLALAGYRSPHDEQPDAATAERCGGCGGHGAVPCSWCDGTAVDPGRWSDDDICAACDGQGDEPCPDCAEPDWSRP